eukprot:CAMPEP_0117542768 /NCGR_PEP_ID=MMETSP0784-20121206/44718_1 /TAXON_ID=39447 /ORGANISM="" /LENGTH=149 /DNA_ID=CAMNT_0005339531 /DNA_START=48 /DNA_END=497 /DNA_ORIENTATION=-
MTATKKGGAGIQLRYGSEVFAFEPSSGSLDVSVLYAFAKEEILFKQQAGLQPKTMRIVDRGRVLPHEGWNLKQCGLWDEHGDCAVRRHVLLLGPTCEQLALVQGENGQGAARPLAQLLVLARRTLCAWRCRRRALHGESDGEVSHGAMV